MKKVDWNKITPGQDIYLVDGNQGGMDRQWVIKATFEKFHPIKRDRFLDSIGKTYYSLEENDPGRYWAIFPEDPEKTEEDLMTMLWDTAAQRDAFKKILSNYKRKDDE